MKPAYQNPLRSALMLTLLLNSSCAVRLRNPSTGAEHLVGFGQVRWRSDALPDGRATVTSGSVVPGLGLGLGYDEFGFTFGWAQRQQLGLGPGSPSDQPVEPPRIHGPRWPARAGGHWFFGHARLAHPRPTARGRSHHTWVTGEALAGLGARLGGEASRVSVGLDTRQFTRVGDESGLVELDSDTRGWPPTDLFQTVTRVPLSSVTNTPNQP